jgi:hypothetical protein
MAVNLSPVGGAAAQFFDNNGVILSGGKIYTYVAGTTTNQTTYTSSAGNVAHTNPIILDSAARVPSGEIWLTDSVLYKFVLKNSLDVLIGTYNNIAGINPANPTTTASKVSFTGANGVTTTVAALGTSTGANLVGYTASGYGAISTTVQTALNRSINLSDYCADLTGATDCLAGVLNAISSLGAKGGEILVPAGSVIGLSDTLLIGNGTSTTASTQDGVYFRALGGGAGPFGDTKGVTFKWLSTNNKSIIQFQGPMLGGGLQGSWTLDGNNYANNGLVINHLVDGDFGDLRIQNCKATFVNFTTQSTIDYYGGCRNNFVNSIIIPSLPDGATGLRLDAVITTTNGNVLQNTINLVDISDVAENNATAIYLGWADFNIFNIVDITGTTGGTSVGVKFQGTSQAFVPFMNRFGVYANSMGETTFAGQHPYGNFIEVYDYPDSGARWPTAEGLSGFGGLYAPSINDTLNISFGFKSYGFNTITPSVPATGLGNAVTNTNAYPVSIYMTPASGSNVPGTHIIDQHGVDNAIGTPLYLKLGAGAKVYFASTPPGAWIWYGEVF